MMTDEEFDAALDGSPAQAMAAKEQKARELPTPKAPMKVARALLKFAEHPLRHWRGNYYRHVGTHWAAMDADEVRKWIYGLTESAVFMVPDKEQGQKPYPWNPDRKKVADVLDALNTGLVRHQGEPARGIFTQNGQVLPAASGKRKLVSHSAESTFNLHALPFHYDPSACCPNWLDFLKTSLPYDTNAHDFLQEWFGYVLSGRTDIHVMACLIGEPRAGKGVTARVLEALCGADAHTGIALEDLTPARPFGKSALIGKLMAVISEPDWRTGQQAVETLLRITGGDPIHIDRKYDPVGWYGAVGARVMVLANDPPRLVNRSGALAARIRNVRFTESFVGREDPFLTQRLLGELPGILNWALDGLDRLERWNRFTEPYSHTELDQQFRDYADPDAAFLADACTVSQDAKCTEEEALKAYRAWCRRTGRTKDSTDAVTLRQRLVNRTSEGIVSSRLGKAKVRWFLGLCPDEYAFEDGQGLSARRWTPPAGWHPAGSISESFE